MSIFNRKLSKTMLGAAVTHQRMLLVGTCGIGFALIWFLTGCIKSEKEQHGAQESLELQQYDAGIVVVEDAKQIQHRFAFPNPTSERVHLSIGAISCQCTQATILEECVEPNGVVVVDVSANLVPDNKKHSISVTLLTDSLSTPHINLTLQWESFGSIVAHDNTTSRNIKIDESGSSAVELRFIQAADSVEPFQPMVVECSDDHARITRIEYDAIQTAEKSNVRLRSVLIRLIWSRHENALPKYEAAPVDLRLFSGVQSTVYRLNFVQDRSINFSQRSLFVHLKDGTLSGKVRLTSESPFTIKDFSTKSLDGEQLKPDFLQVKASKWEDGRADLDVIVDSVKLLRPSFYLELKTDKPSSPLIGLPVYVYCHSTMTKVEK